MVTPFSDSAGLGGSRADLSSNSSAYTSDITSYSKPDISSYSKPDISSYSKPDITSYKTDSSPSTYALGKSYSKADIGGHSR